jgi:transposase InsO family protein
MRGLKARLASQLESGELQLPSLRSLERWMGQWRAKHKEVVAALSAPDHYKNKFMVAFGSQSEGVERINQRWEMDSTPADVMLLDGRYTVLGVIDVYTRRMRLIVSKSSKSVAVCALLRVTLLTWGVPEEVKTDNGSDYVSKHTRRALDGLGVTHKTCAPFSPWQKPHIERGLGTFARSLMELLPGFIGHNVSERKHIEERKSFADRLMTRGECVEVRMTAEAFQGFCDKWVNDLYHHDQHQGLGKRTPFEVAAAAQDTVRVINDERVLDVLLAEAPDRGGLRTVQKKGIKHDGAHFIAPELEAHVGRNVTVRFDALDHDLGRLYVFGEEGFICVAECPERTGMDRREVAIKAKAMQTARVQAERAALKKAAKKVGTDTVVEEILTTRAQAAGKLAHQNRPGQVPQGAQLGRDFMHCHGATTKVIFLVSDQK